MSCPWAKVQATQQIVNFDEITSEELAKSLQEKEFQKHANTVIEPPEESEKPEVKAETDTDCDEAIAYTLQAQFNKEHDLVLKRTEEKYNGRSKVNISFSNYRTCPTECSETKVTEDEKRDFDRFVSVEKEVASIPRCGYKKVNDGEDSQIVTKHDMLLSSRINACRVLEFPPGIETGDTGGFDLKLNNKVFNSLRAHSHAHCSKEKAKTRPPANSNNQTTKK